MSPPLPALHQNCLCSSCLTHQQQLTQLITLSSWRHHFQDLPPSGFSSFLTALCLLCDSSSFLFSHVGRPSLGLCCSTLSCVLSFPWCAYRGPWSSIYLFTRLCLPNYIVHPELFSTPRSRIQLPTYSTSLLGCLTDISNWTCSKLNSWSSPHFQSLFHPKFPPPQLMRLFPVAQIKNNGFLSFSHIPYSKREISLVCLQNIPRIWSLLTTSTTITLVWTMVFRVIAAIAS